MQTEITVEIKSVSEVLKHKNLHIPDYQRPYKWERRHIRNLFYDICESTEKNISEYRIGSIILHENSESLDIVDGQQRLISLSLLLRQFDGSKSLINGKYIGISRKHAKENSIEWEVLCKSVGEVKSQRIKDFIIDNCKFSVIQMPSDKLAEAFQLFDSQNNRGKALEPHDLLKAYHLRAIKEPSEDNVKKWEEFVGNKELSLKDLFDKHLFRIRRWSNGDAGLYKKQHGSELRFSERFVDDFKGVNLAEKDYPYLRLYKELEKNNIEFPISICMPIINGENFFKYIEYCYNIFSAQKLKVDDWLYKSKFARSINLYENITALFFDRFESGEYDEEMKEKVFVWAFYPRVESKMVYDATIANYAGVGLFHKKNDYQKLFQKLSISATPREFIAGINMELLENYTKENMIKQLRNMIKQLRNMI